MKKVLISLMLLSILAVLFIPLVKAQASEELTNYTTASEYDSHLPNECCKLKHKISIGGGPTYKKGNILVASKDGANCSLKKGETLYRLGPGDEATQSDRAYAENGYSLYCLLGTIYWVTNLVFLAAILLVVILIIVGGIMIMTAAGDEAKVKKGKNFILYALIGFVVAILAKAVPALAKFFIGM